MGMMLEPEIPLATGMEPWLSGISGHACYSYHLHIPTLNAGGCADHRITYLRSESRRTKHRNRTLKGRQPREEVFAYGLLYATTTSNMDPSMLTDMILDLEDKTWRALMDTGTALLPFLSPECIMLFPMGLKISAKTVPSIEDVMKSEAFVPWRRYRLSEVEVRPLGPEAAIITYRAKATRQHITHDDDERQDEFSALISSTWQKDPEAGKWLMCVHQQTPYELEV